MKYVSLRGNLEAPRWIFYVLNVLIGSGFALIALGLVVGGSASLLVVGGIEVALGTGIAVKVIRKRQNNQAGDK